MSAFYRPVNLRQPQGFERVAPAYADALCLWACTDSPNKAFDASANKNDLIPGAMPAVQLRGHGKTYTYNKSSTYLESTRAIPIGKTFTVFAWVRPATTGNTGYTRIIDCDFAAGFYLGSNTSSKYAFIVNNSSLEGCIGGQQVAGQLDFVAGVYDGTNRMLYVNGSLAQSASATAPSTSKKVSVGRTLGTSTGYWGGDIDTVGVFPRAFSAQQIMSLYIKRWQLFAAPQQPIYQDWATSGPSGFLPAWIRRPQRTIGAGVI